MAAKLGAILTRCALGPVSYAGGCIMASKVPDGLRELAPEGLWAGLERGIDEVAQRVGVGRMDVQSLLPMGELQVAMNLLGAAQRDAVAAWQLYAGHLGGLMAGIADLTVDGRSPDAGLCLERLAKKVSRDKPLAGPLHTLADAVTRWQELLEASCLALEDENTGGRLAKMYRRRQLAKAALAGSVAVVVVAVGALVAVYALARSRVDAALLAADPCAVHALAAGDSARASEPQKARLAERSKTCDEGRAAEAKRVEDQHAHEAKVAAEERVRAAHAAACRVLAEHLAARSIDDADRAVAGDAASLLERVATRSLQAADLGPKDAPLPCLDTAMAGAVRAVFARAVVVSEWTRSDALSPAARSALAETAGDVPRWAKGVVAARADAAARQAIRSGDPDSMEHAAALCELTTSLHWPAGGACAGVLAKRTK